MIMKKAAPNVGVINIIVFGFEYEHCRDENAIIEALRKLPKLHLELIAS